MENKMLLLLQAPISTRSGYGSRSRDIAKVLIESDKYEVVILPTPWGNTPQNALNPNNADDKAIIDRILAKPELPRKPDVFIQITVPNEFQPMGVVNIGITAGIETNICDASWIEGCNRMDLVLASSKHSKDVLVNTVYTKTNPQTNQPEAELKCVKPVEVLIEGANLEIYRKIEKASDLKSSIAADISKIPESFAFLMVGHWLKGDIGHDRKDIGMLVKVFIDTFRKKATKPALILKTSGATYSIIDREEILRKIEAIKSSYNGEPIPNIYLIHGELDDTEINELYNHPKVKVHISFTKGEGFGRPLLEASLSAKPVVAPNYSGHVDFLTPHSQLLPGTMAQLHPSAVWQGMLNPESSWFTVNYGYASQLMRHMFEKYDTYIDKAKRQAYLSKNEFSMEKMRDSLLTRLEDITKNIPRQVQLTLPKLKKIENAGFTLPKLKKIENAEEVKTEQTV